MFKGVSVEEGFVQGQYCETRNPDEGWAYLSNDDEQLILAGLPLVEV